MSQPPRRNNLVFTFRTVSSHRLLLITALVVFGVAGAAITRSFAFRANFSPVAAPSLAAGQESRAGVRSKESIALLKFAGLRGAAAPFSPTRMLAPTVTATKTDSLFTDVDGDLQADPGDTLKYTVNISASGDDATGVTFTDTVDPNTAFVPGSLTATPVAVDDSYSALGNVRISVPAPGVLGNDFAGVPAATITAPSTSTNGGDVAVNPDGSFTYNPPAGFEGNDSFSYTLTNASGSNPATVTIAVSGMIWFINNTASCPCDGRLTNPFNTLASFAAVNNGAGNNPAANDNIFLYESAVDYIGPVTLLNGQRFIGQDSTASLSAITGLTPPTYSDPLPAMNSGNAIIVNITSAGNSINVASGNTLRGFTGGNSLSDISGTGFGTLTVSDVTLNGSGQALDLTTGTLAATFVSISSTNSATTGISLTSVAGNLTTPSTFIMNPAGSGISVNTSSATLNFGNTDSIFSGATGVSLLTNTGTITFVALNISPDLPQRGLHATDNTNTITSTSGVITTNGNTAVEVTRAIGTTPLALTLTNVSQTGGTNGIVLTNTSGSFTITSTGAPDTGGIIQNTTGSGIAATNAQNLSLTRIRIINPGLHGIDAQNLKGTNLLDNSTIIDWTAATGNGFNVVSNNSNLTLLTISASTFNGSNTSNDGVFMEAQGTSSMALSVENGSVFTDMFGDGVQVNGITGATGTVSATIKNSTFNNAAVLGNGGVSLNPFGGINFTADIDTNTFDTIMRPISTLGAIGMTNGLTASADISVQGNILNNIIGARGITFTGDGTGANTLVFDDNDIDRLGSNSKMAINVNLVNAATADVFITNNSIGQAANLWTAVTGNADAILVQTQNTATMDATISGNVVDANTAFEVVRVRAINASSLNATVTGNDLQDTVGGHVEFDASTGTGVTAGGTICLNMSGNTLPAAGVGVIRLAEGAAPGDINVTQASSAALSTANSNATVTITGTPDFGQPACTTPSMMMASPPQTEKQSQAQIDGSAANQKTDIVMVDRRDDPLDNYPSRLGSGEVSWMMHAALERWREAGISADDFMRMQAMTFEVTDLPDGQLATATATHMKIDETAAGYGWYVDAAPLDDEEFDVAVPGLELQTTEYSRAFRRIDLMTVVMRELGQAIKQGRKGIPKQMRALMEGTLPPAVRHLPDSRVIKLPSSRVKGSELISRMSKGSALGPKAGTSRSAVSIKKAGSNARANKAEGQNTRLMHHAPRNRTTATTFSSMLADVMLNIGTLPAGESVTITFNVTVDNPFTGALPQVSNQGTVSGSNFADVLTDDPTVGGTADPTVTPIDLPDVTVAVSPSSVLEDGATNLVYTFTRTGSTAAAITVNFNVTGSSASASSDYTVSGTGVTFNSGLGTGTVIIPAGSATATVTVDPSADITVEPDETVIVNVASGTGYDTGSPGSATGTITNDDTDVTLAVSPSSVSEDGAGNLVYTFTRVGVTSNSLTVNFSIDVGGNNAVFPADYSQSGAATYAPPLGTVTFGAGNSTATVTVTPAADLLVEPDETVILTVTSGVGYNVGSPSVATGTITNDDAEVSVTVTPSSVTEDGPTNLVYTFTRTGFTLLPVTVNFSVGTGPGTASFPGDYSQSGATTYGSSSGTVTFAANSSTATVTIDPVTDSTVEGDETVDITVEPGVGYNVGSPSAASGTITDDDANVTVSVSPSSVAEDGAANLDYTFTRDNISGGALTVNFSVGGSASFPGDYSQSGAATFSSSSGTVTFAAASLTATVTIDPATDNTVELDETVDIALTPGAGYTIGSPSAASGTITDDDANVTVSVSPSSVAEDGAANLDYTFTRDNISGGALTVNFSVGGSASFPGDYSQSGAATFSSSSGTVTFAAASLTATVTIDPATDNTVELDETVDIALTPGAGYTIGSPSAASGTITNDDADVSVAVSPSSVAEDGATNLVYTFTRTGFTGAALTVSFSVSGSASFPTDYSQSGATTFSSSAGTVTFGVGNNTATVTIDPVSDTTIETDETVILTLTSGTGYNVSTPDSATGTITNDDADVSVAVAPASVAEDGAANLVYTFTRSNLSGGALTVNFSVGGTAVFGPSPDDYTQTGATTYTTTSGSVTFAPGSPTAMVTVDPEVDTTAEADETVVITLTGGASYNVVSPNSATGTILNDDTLVSVVVAPTSTAEGGANLVYTFTRTGPTTSALVVNFSVGGTASFPADYSQSGATTFTPPTATVTFGVGSSTATVTVTPLTDCVVEGNETVVFTVQPGTGYGVGSPSSATGTITNTPDSSAPTITLIPNVNMTLWPPNHQYESIAVTDFVASASDDCDPSVNVNSVYIVQITSDEAENGNGDGNTLNDIVIGGAGCKTAQLRSERTGNGDGRVYSITFKVKDSAGNFATATTSVTVRKSPNKPAVDSGTQYVVNSICP